MPTLSALNEAWGQVTLVNVQDLHRSLTAAVIKLCITDAMDRSNAMPVEPFRQLFISWGY